jgi:cell division protein FtsL
MTATRGAVAPQLERRPQPGPARAPSTRLSWATFSEGLTAILICGGLLLGVASAAAAITQAGYNLDHAKHVLATTQDAEQRLAVQVASLQAPARLAAIATSRLGMSLPTSFDTVQPQPVQNPPAPRPHAAVITIAAVSPGPGSLTALWDSLRTFVAHMR